MAGHLPSDMLLRMDWNADNKLTAWTFYRERLEQYFVIASTPEDAKVTHILFYGGKEASERWTALKDQVDETKQKDADTVFKAFANSFKKSSSHWQARDEYLTDIKQAKHQIMAELDTYIKGLVRSCQFSQTEQESCKIDLLYHATAHFEVRKFVHNAKPEELTCDKIIELAKADERACQPIGLHAASVARRTTGLSSVEALGGGTVHQDGHPPWEGQSNQGKEDLVASSSTQAGDKEEEEAMATRTPKRPGAGWGHGGKPHKTFSLTVADLSSGPSHPLKVISPGTKVVSIKAAGEQFINTFTCDALRGNGIEEYSLPSNKGKAYTDTRQ